MGFLPATGFGAGAGGQMLQQIQDAQQRAAEIAQQQELARQHLLLDQQEAQQKSQLAQATLQSVNQQRQAEEQKLADARAGQATGMLTPQTVMSPTSGILKMVQGTPYESLFQPDQSLGSANISGAAGGPMNVTANPGQATGQVRYLGTPGQLQQQGQDAARGRFMAAHPELADAFGALDQKELGPAITDVIKGQLLQPKAAKQYEVTVPGPNGQPMRKLVSADDLAGGIQEYKPPTQDHYVLQTIPDPTDPQKTIIVRVDTTSGQASPVSMNGQNLSGKSGISTQTRQMGEGAQGVLTGALPRLQQAAADLDKAGLFGPVNGRLRDLVAGKIGAGQVAADLAGNDPAKRAAIANLIGRYTTQLGLLQTAVARVHGGARGGGSPAMLQHMQHIMNGTSADLPTFQGEMQAVSDQMTDYMKEAGLAPAGGSGGTTLSAAELLKKYGG